MNNHTLVRKWLLGTSPSRLRSLGAFIADDQVLRQSPIPELNTSFGRTVVLLPPRETLIWGNQDIEGLHFIVSLAKELNALNVLEIGTFNGATAWCFAANLPKATVHTLDLPAADEAALPLSERDQALRGGFGTPVYKRFPYEGKLVQHWGDSATFDYSRIGPCDLVYIDGAHTYEYVKSDTLHAMTILKDDGAIVWDDYSRRWPGNVRYLDELSKAHDLYRVPGTRLVVLVPERVIKNGSPSSVAPRN